MKAYLPIVLVAAGACSSKQPAPPAPPAAPSRIPLGVDDVTGLSGMARDADGTLWLVSERGRQVIGYRGGAIQRLRVEGVDRGLDLESVAILADGSWLFGLEDRRPDAGTDQVLLASARRDGDRVILGQLEPVDMTPWHAAIKPNKGVEGLCVAGDAVVFGIETAVERDGGRFAPVGVRRGAGSAWQVYWLRLSSVTGTLSALACRQRGGAVELFASERHFGVLRLLRAELPAQPGEIEPLVTDLDAFAAETKLNIEGLEIVGDDLMAVVDNHYGRVQGPNELVSLPGRAR